MRSTQKLSYKQTLKIWTEVVPTKEAKPVRFLLNGEAVDIYTGHIYSRGTNIIHQPVYWNFTPCTAKKIAKWLGLKAVFSN